jgi:murein DD-endopeptidase MepM/ murein hydrolase activator NlpD
MALPIKNGKITTPWAKKGPHWSTGFHTGVDFAVPVGTEVLAAANGTIMPSGWGKSYGLQLVCRVKGGFVIYAHLSKTLVKPGDKVKKNQVIGLSGNTGNSTGPHLHFELRNQARWTGGRALDPTEILSR